MRVPPAWSAQHVLQQLFVLVVAGVAALVVALDSPVLQAVLAPLPSLVAPGGLVLPSQQLAPLLLPLVLGVPLALTRHRAPLLLWVALAVLLAGVGVLEVARLNWASFVGGVAFRVESGPVPFLRTLAGLVLVLCGVVLIAHQSVHAHVVDLAGRGVAREELAVVRRNLLRREQGVVLGAAGAGVVLLGVAALSMQLTERAPGDGEGFVAAAVWAGLLLGVFALMVAGWARRRRSQGEDLELRP